MLREMNWTPKCRPVTSTVLKGVEETQTGSQSVGFTGRSDWFLGGAATSGPATKVMDWSDKWEDDQGGGGFGGGFWSDCRPIKPAAAKGMETPEPDQESKKV